MKGLKKLLAVLLAFVMVVGLMSVTPAEAKVKKEVFGVPAHVSGECWMSMSAYGGYVKEGTVLKADADYYLSYELYVPMKAFDEWNVGSMESNGGWTSDDYPCGKLNLIPYVGLYSPSTDESRYIYANNEWSINHYKGDGDEFIIDTWTEETGSLFVDEVEGEGVMKVEVVDDMAKVTVKDLPATGHEILMNSEATDWEMVPVDGFVGDEDMMFGIEFHQWIGGPEVEVVYLTKASIKMGKKTIWKSGDMKDEWVDGFEDGPYSGAGEDGEGGWVEYEAVPFTSATLSFSNTKATVAAKKSVTIKYATMNADDKVTAVSSNNKIAKVKVSKGKIKITGKKKGKATITVTNGDVSKKIKVTVK